MPSAAVDIVPCSTTALYIKRAVVRLSIRSLPLDVIGRVHSRLIGFDDYPLASTVVIKRSVYRSIMQVPFSNHATAAIMRNYHQVHQNGEY